MSPSDHPLVQIMLIVMIKISRIRLTFTDGGMSRHHHKQQNPRTSRKLELHTTSLSLFSIFHSRRHWNDCDSVYATSGISDAAHTKVVDQEDWFEPQDDDQIIISGVHDLQSVWQIPTGSNLFYSISTYHNLFDVSQQRKIYTFSLKSHNWFQESSDETLSGKRDENNFYYFFLGNKL